MALSKTLEYVSCWGGLFVLPVRKLVSFVVASKGMRHICDNKPIRSVCGVPLKSISKMSIDDECQVIDKISRDAYRSEVTMT